MFPTRLPRPARRLLLGATLAFAILAPTPTDLQAEEGVAKKLRSAVDKVAAIIPGAPPVKLNDLEETVRVRASMPRLREKIQSGRPIHVAYLGGSITQNTKGHTSMVSEFLREMKVSGGVESEFRFTNAGLSSTCSTSGAFRLESHVLKHGPVDLLIVEFAVNDDQDAGHNFKECVRGMEGVIRRTRKHNPNAEIVIAHYVNPEMLETLQKGETPLTIRAHEKVAEHYRLNSVNVAASVAGAIQRGEYSWKDYGGTHPKAFGYLAASARIYHAILSGLSSRAPGTTAYALPAPIDEQCYDAGKFIAPQEAQLSGNWKSGKATKQLMPVGAVRSQYNGYKAIRAERAGDSLTLPFKGRAIGAFVLAGPDAGMVETRLDGGEWTSHNLYHRHSRGLNYPRSVLFHSGLERRDHTLELRIAEATDARSQGRAATILYFEVDE